MDSSKKRKLKKYLKRISIFVIVVMLISILGLYYCYSTISNTAKPFIYDDIDKVPSGSIALVLGTSKSLRNGSPNPYFTYRINATKDLYHAGKLKGIVVSGDNRYTSYNEPKDMRKALKEAGIPDSIITSDYAGFRTLDSVIRMSKIFGQNKYIVVSQEFHNERAIYIARKHDIEAYGYNAKDLNRINLGYKTKVREIFARVKVFIDLLLGKEPYFLGEKEEISLAQDSINFDMNQ